MAPHKCNYLVFTNSNLNVSGELKIKLNGIELKYDNNPTFLGIRFDNHLTFKNQIDYYDYIERHYMLIMCSFLFTRK